jgi:hypothetical protein
LSGLSKEGDLGQRTETLKAELRKQKMKAKEMQEQQKIEER